MSNKFNIDIDKFEKIRKDLEKRLTEKSDKDDDTLPIEEKLKKLIKEKYNSVRAFSVSAGIPYTTIDNVFKRGTSGLRLKTVSKICSSLDIDFNEFIYGRIVSNDFKNIDISELEEDEKRLLYHYRKTDESGKAFISLLAERESNRINKK